MMGKMFDLMGKMMGGGRADARDQQEQNRLAADMTAKHDAQMKKMQDEQKEQAAEQAEKVQAIMEKFKEDQAMMDKKLAEAQKQAEQDKRELLEDMAERAQKFTKNYANNMDKLKQKQTAINAAYPPPKFYADLMKKLRVKYGPDKCTQIPIVALCGGTGEGKSSWLNECLTQSGSDERANVGAGGECTVQMDHYEWLPDGINPVVFIDCPGGGTVNFPAADYVRTIGLRYYDAALFFCCERFQEADTQIINDCNRYKVNYFAVKTKVGASVKNVKYDCKNLSQAVPSKDEIKELLRKTLYSMPNVETGQIMLTGVPMDNIYLSDSRDWDNYETDQLLTKLGAVCKLGRSVNVQFNKDTGKWENGDAEERERMSKIEGEMALLRQQTGGGGSQDDVSAMDG